MGAAGASEHSTRRRCPSVAGVPLTCLVSGPRGLSVPLPCSAPLCSVHLCAPQADDSTGDFYSLHGALILLGWMVVMPIGLYYVRWVMGSIMAVGS